MNLIIFYRHCILSSQVPLKFIIHLRDKIHSRNKNDRERINCHNTTRYIYYRYTPETLNVDIMASVVPLEFSDSPRTLTSPTSHRCDATPHADTTRVESSRQSVETRVNRSKIYSCIYIQDRNMYVLYYLRIAFFLCVTLKPCETIALFTLCVFV